MRALFSDPDFRWLRDGYVNEYPVVLQSNLEVPSMAYGEWVDRIADDKYRLLITEYETEEAIAPDGTVIRIPRRDGAGRMVPRRDDAGRVIRRPPPNVFDAVLMPFHEAVKRSRGRGGRGRYRQPYYWLRATLLWRGSPCLCAHRDVVEHLAGLFRTTEAEVERGVLAAARECRRWIERTEIANGQLPDNVRGGPHSRHRAGQSEPSYRHLAGKTSGSRP